MTPPKLYLDLRRVLNGAASLRIIISVGGKRKMISPGVKLPVDYWDADKARLSVKCPNSIVLNNRIGRFLAIAEEEVIKASMDGITDIDLISNNILKAIFPDKEIAPPKPKVEPDNLFKVFKEYMENKTGNTLYSYQQTYNRVIAFTQGDENVNISDIKKPWLMAFEAFLSKTAKSPNGRAVYMRNLRAVCNFALDMEYTDNYPFRKFHIKTVATAKRSLSVESLRKLISLVPAESEVKYRDMWLLSFYLLGINFADLLSLPAGADKDGYIEFHRAKTNRLYRIKIEPEAQTIIDAYRGEKWLLNPRDTCQSPTTFLVWTNRTLQKMGNTQIVNSHGKKVHEPAFPNITTYWARHTWATIASLLDVPKDTIRAALGHGDNTVTDIYIDFHAKKVERANRKVIDYVLHGKINGTGAAAKEKDGGDKD